MDASISLWIEYLLRFSHLVAGIAWIGSSFYFIWMDGSFQAPEQPRKNVEGELFMVHGGFYYQVEKRKIYPGELPKTLHWFKWEATLTWITGFGLFAFLYYLKSASLLIDPRVFALSPVQAILLSVAVLVGSWLVYDLLWHPAFVRFHRLKSIASILLLGPFVYSLTRVYSGRGAFMLTGISMGSMMLLNVWIRILPGQAKMLRDAQQGKVPDYTLSLKSKTRSVHNTYFIFPVLFVMLSNHYPILYNHPMNWILLILMIFMGALTRHAMVTRNPLERWTLVPAVFAFVGLLVLTAPVGNLSHDQGAAVDFSEVRKIVEVRCLSCHSSKNSDDVYKQAPNGVLFETEDQIRQRSERIYLHVVQAKSMPLVNKTMMTEEEREKIGRWLKQEKLVPSL
jgi:uncharacterized membrane protein